ncbi:MAG: hypothetical protein AB9873_17660 [Syntrophobacteraceae bacterium]
MLVGFRSFKPTWHERSNYSKISSEMGVGLVICKKVAKGLDEEHHGQERSG